MSHKFLRPPRRAPHAEPSAAPPAQARRDTPQPLPPALRSTAEQRFGADFSAVRIHAGPAAGDAEARADAAATQVLQGRQADAGVLGSAPVGVQWQSTAAADAGAAPDLPAPVPLLPGLPQTLHALSLGPDEVIDARHAGLAQLAAAARAQPGAGVRVSADLPESSQYDSARQARERARLDARMRRIRDVLHELGVDEARVDLQGAYGFSTRARGQVELALRTSPGALPAAPRHQLPPPVPPAPAVPGFAPDLELRVGPLTVSLPKQVRASLPLPLRKGFRLTLDMSLELPAKFGLQLMLDGLPQLRVGLQGGAGYDTGNAVVLGSAGLVIESRATTVLAVDPGETREKIRSAGDKLNQAARAFEAAAPDDKLSRAMDIASALGEIYEAMDRAKAGGKPLPRMALELGYKPTAPEDSQPPGGLPAVDKLGVDFSWRF